MGTISPLCHDGAEPDSTLRVRLLGFLKHIFSFIVLYTAIVYQDLLHEIGFELEHGAGGQNPVGPEILCMILRSFGEATFGTAFLRLKFQKQSAPPCQRRSGLVLVGLLRILTTALCNTTGGSVPLATSTAFPTEIGMGESFSTASVAVDHISH